MCADVLVCTCARGCVSPSPACRGGLQDGTVPRAAQPPGEGGTLWQRCCSQSGLPSPPRSGSPAQSAPVTPREGTAVPGCPGSVCGTGARPKLLKQLCLCGCSPGRARRCWHTARAPRGPEHPPVALRAQKLLREDFDVLYVLWRGEHEAGMRNALPFIQKDHILNVQCCL